ncbi:MAG: cytochrome d ubiquinol oxidase subunit II [Bacteroidales bacterium]|jgi:cytochrome d ubiquinol oxidase subunit II|nr:cytochrome d ubiquinol oxidase subunit II [Bacteroidales bacterium]
MLLAISHTFLQEYWWLLVSLLASLLVFLMFVQGGQSFIFTLASDEGQKTMIVNAMGRKWEFTFTTLVTFGGAFFASFPLFYATSFGGAYWVWMAILFSFVIQAIAYEYRSKPSNVLGKKTFDVFLFINGALGPLLIGIAVATFFTGANYSLNEMNNVKWATPWHGLEAVLSLRNLSLGIAVLFLARLLGLMYIINSIDDSELIAKARKKAVINLLPFLAGFLYFVISLFVSEGFAVDPASGEIFMEKGKYFHNLLQMPLVMIAFLAGTLLVLFGLYRTVLSDKTDPVWFGGPGTILVVLSLFLLAGYNNTAFYPSLTDLQSSLTIRNASSSHFTLKTMFYISFIIPVVFAYIWYAWSAINRKKIDKEEMSGDGHMY